MKYNEELYEISKNLNITNDNDIEESLEIELLEVLLKKFRENNYTIKDDCIILTFNYPIFGNPESGYNLIYSLAKSGKFNKIAKEYCFYITNINFNHSDYTDDNIEIIWDYKSYNEGIKSLKLKNTNNS